MDARIAYHLRELEIARNPQASGHAMPTFSESDRAILDIGCGIGQTFAASPQVHGRFLVGIDIDLDSQKWGRDAFGDISFVNSDANTLPFASGSFDLVISRVSLPYTHISLALGEIARVLKPGGRVWLTMHSFQKTWKRWVCALRSFHAKEFVYCSYIIGNGVLFNLSGCSIAWPLNHRYESFQTVSGITKALRHCGFVDIEATKRTSFYCSARKAREPNQGPAFVTRRSPTP